MTALNGQYQCAQSLTLSAHKSATSIRNASDGPGMWFVYLQICRLHSWATVEMLCQFEDPHGFTTQTS